ncbi:MAG TPA: hypothetical protein VI685_06590 [Candidatus Angelobacter sp.]
MTKILKASGVLLVVVITAVAQAQTAREQLNQLVAQLQTTPADDALREKIIKLALDLKPQPALPEEANRRMARGRHAFKEAKSDADFKDAAAEFRLATLAAPWDADAYYNLGMAQKKANDFAAAAGSFKLYLIAAPDAPDAKAAQTLLYEMEFEQEKANREKAAQAAAGATAARARLEQEAARIATQRANTQRQQLLHNFEGNWYVETCYRTEHSKPKWDEGCNQEEHDGANFHRSMSTETHRDAQITFFGMETEGTVGLGGLKWGKGSCPPIYGVPIGPSFDDIKWEGRPYDNSAAQPIYSLMQEDGSQFEISCDRPIVGASSVERYHYRKYVKVK